MKNLLLLVSSVLLLVSCRMSISFHVTDEDTGKPVEQAKVIAGYSKVLTATGADGYARLEKISRYRWLRASNEVYLSKEIYQRNYSDGDTIEVVMPPTDERRMEVMQKEDSVNALKWALEDAAYPVERTDSLIFDESAYYHRRINPGQWLHDNLVYPRYAVERGEQGKVYIRFTVQPDGNVTHVEVRKGVSYSLDRAAVQTVRNMPNFPSPVLRNGRPVKLYFNLPVYYKLQ